MSEEEIAAPRAIRITDEIHQVGGPERTAPDDAAVYVVNCNGHAALIDAGCGRATETLLSNIEAAGAHPDHVEVLLITHGHVDHTGGAKVMRERLHCPVVMHERDARFLELGDQEVTAAAWWGGAKLPPRVVDRTLSGKQEDIRLGRRIMTAAHIPGHSPGSVAYATSSLGSKVVFA